MFNSTVSNNTSTTALAPAIFSAEGARILNTTIAFNSQGGIRFSDYAPSELTNSILAKNGSVPNNCWNTDELRHGAPSISDDLTCGDSTVVTIGDAHLAALADNGGPTMTHALTPQSLAFNGSATGCGTAVDQRYKARDTHCDIGSFELDPAKVTITIDPNVKIDAAGRALLAGTVTCARAETFKLAVELHQQQKSGKQVVDVHAAATPQVMCGTAPTSWTQEMVLTDGVWKSGSAQATAQTYQTPEWVEPASVASGVRVSTSRK